MACVVSSLVFDSRSREVKSCRLLEEMHDPCGNLDCCNEDLRLENAEADYWELPRKEHWFMREEKRNKEYRDLLSCHDGKPLGRRSSNDRVYDYSFAFSLQRVPSKTRRYAMRRRARKERENFRRFVARTLNIEQILDKSTYNGLLENELQYAPEAI